MQIKNLTTKKISDSRGKPTVEVEIETSNGVFSAQTPSGTSAGAYEALEIDAEKAVYNVREIIAKKLVGKNFTSQAEIDEILIALAGENKAELGANAILPVSIACCRALATEKNLPLYSYISLLVSDTNRPVLPIPCMLLIEGGKHAENNLDVQEFMVVPKGKSFSENYETATNVYNGLKERLQSKFGDRGVATGMEGGFTPQVETTKQVLDLILDIVKNNNCEIGIDVAASEFYKNKTYNFESKKISSLKLLTLYTKLTEKYPIAFIEDPFAQDDTDGWQTTKDLQGRGVAIVGDDITVTNQKRMKDAYEQNLCNAVILKPNQIGTVTETIQAAQVAKEYNWKRIVSHRSGDTEDDFIADLAVGIGAEFIKAGGPYAKERKAKYDRLLAIEKEI
ncbi:MAG: phosphopyruvate hydratase [Parcubacteria group bacterium]|nr:phosphopyruvate hydratase [Parcubacteria group bacterium]